MARWRSAGFFYSARKIRLQGSRLCAELQSIRGEWVGSSIDLNAFIANVDGKLVNGKYEYSLEML